MVFDHCRPSCYDSIEFAQMAEYLRGKFVMAGGMGELSCLSTAVDAHHRDHRPTMLVDALVSRCGKGVPATMMERALGEIVSLYAETDTAEGWMSATSLRLKVHE
jgi:isochorismate hydrolase